MNTTDAAVKIAGAASSCFFPARGTMYGGKVHLLPGKTSRTPGCEHHRRSRESRRSRKELLIAGKKAMVGGKVHPPLGKASRNPGCEHRRHGRESRRSGKELLIAGKRAMYGGIVHPPPGKASRTPGCEHHRRGSEDPGKRQSEALPPARHHGTAKASPTPRQGTPPPPGKGPPETARMRQKRKGSKSTCKALQTPARWDFPF
ncbi:MAG: hypothetical protein GY765_02325 [bacterium]|nr:hypothetical protein [bacterium]